MGKKILFITTYPLEYNTSANIRNLGLIEGLLANGYSISTLSIYPTDITLYNSRLLDLPFEERYWVGGVNNDESSIIKKNNLFTIVKAFVYQAYNLLYVYDRRKSYLRDIKYSFIPSNFDIVISSSDPKSAHLYAEKLIKIRAGFTKSWIQYWGDPFSNDISIKRILGNIIISREERRLLGMADKAVYVSPLTVEYIKNKYPKFADKIEFLPIPYQLSQIDNTEINLSYPVIGYIGDYSSRIRNILPLYSALKRLKIKSYIIGNSDLSLVQTPEITIKQRMVCDEIKKITQEINILICVCNLKGNQIPGKVYHYVNTKKPILIIIDGDNKNELNEYFQSYDRFYICDNNAQAIYNCIEIIIAEKKIFNTPDILNPISISKSFIKL